MRRATLTTVNAAIPTVDRSATNCKMMSIATPLIQRVECCGLYSRSGLGSRNPMRPGGLDPPTNSLEGCCSIHLSYGRGNNLRGLASVYVCHPYGKHPLASVEG